MASSSTQVKVVTMVLLVIFAAAMVLIGFYSSKKAKTIGGFLLGSRKIGAWLSAFAYGTSYFSAVIFIGYAGKHGWDIGFASIWIGVGNALLGCLLAWLVLAKKTRAMTKKLDTKTMPEFFEARYDCKALKLVAALIIFVFLVPYSAAVYKGLGSMFSTIFPGVSENICMLIVALITAAFLVMGGYVATAYTDLFQGIIMIAGVVIMVIVLTVNPTVGGLTAGINKIKDINPELIKTFGGKNWSFLLTNILLTSFGTWGLPQMVNKYYAIKNEKSIKHATVISTLFALLIGSSAYYVGSLGRLYLDNTLPSGSFDYVVPNTLLTALGDPNLLTTIVLAVILILLLSASMSTLSAIVLTSSSAIAVDLLPFVSSKYTNENQMVLMRVLCIIFVALSYLFATLKIAIIVSIMSFSWGVVSGCFIGPYVWGLYSKRITKYGAWAGIIGGFSTVMILTIHKTITADFATAASNSPLFGVMAMAVSVVIVPLVSMLTPRLPDKVIDAAFGK